MDNIFVERLWRSVKYEEVYVKDYGEVSEAVKNLGSYFVFLQSGSSASGFGISDAGSDVLWKRPRAAKTGDATGQSSLRSSLLGDAGAKFFCGKRREGGKKEKRKKHSALAGIWRICTTRSLALATRCPKHEAQRPG